MTARAMLLSFPPLSAKRLRPARIRVDGVEWLQTSLGDGSFAFQAACPACKRRLLTGFLRVQPAAVHCACGRWARLP
jgi:hypothetical protein